jgi:hypothetical protein
MPTATQKLATPQSELATEALSPKGPVARRPQADLRGHEDFEALTKPHSRVSGFPPLLSQG